MRFQRGRCDFSVSWKKVVVSLLVLLCAEGIHLLPTSTAGAQDSIAESKPSWVSATKPPTRIGQKCFLGTSPSTRDRNQALADSYKNALLNVIEREFPDLISISTRSSEKLEGSTYSRDTVFKSENVQFSGLTEDRDSPFIEANESNTSFVAYRLLCWSDRALANEKNRHAALNSEKKAIVTNTIDGLLPSSSKPGPTGELEVTTVPAGATILLAAMPVGTSNARLEKVIEGTYDLVVQKEGFEIESRKVTIRAGKKLRLEILLQRIRSTITVKSEPHGALVYVNNKPLDKRTPVTFEQVIGDEADVRLEMDDFHAERRILTATSSSREENFTLRPQDAVISVLSTPSGAAVLLNETEVGTTPLVGKKVSGGRHKITVRFSGYEDVSEEFEVFKSRPFAFTPKLKPRSKANLALSAKRMEEDRCPPDSANSCNSLREETPEFLFSECENANLDACVGLGILLVQGRGVEQNENKARQIFQLACDGNVAKACLYLGQMWENGTGGRRHRPVAEQFFSRARSLLQGFCQDGDPDSCFNLGVLWSQGKGGNKDSNKSNFYFRQSCKFGRKQACTQFLEE